MSAEIIQFIPKPNPNRQRELEKEAAVYPRVIYGIDLESVEMIPYGGKGIDGMPYYSPESDPA